MTTIKLRRALFFAVLFATATWGHAQSASTMPSGDELNKTVAGLDAALFDAYNTCNLDKLGAMVGEDLEFYHDQTGLAVGRQSFIDAIHNNICGKVHRTLVPGSLEVYPLKGYGAVEICVHRFTHPNDPDPGPGGEAKSIMLWRFDKGGWKVERVISFDHHSLTK